MRPEAMVRVAHRPRSEAGDVALVERIAPEQIVHDVDRTVAIASITAEVRGKTQDHGAIEQYRIRPPTVVRRRIGDTVTGARLFAEIGVSRVNDERALLGLLGCGQNPLGECERDCAECGGAAPARLAQRLTVKTNARECVAILRIARGREQFGRRPIKFIGKIRVAIAPRCR